MAHGNGEKDAAILKRLHPGNGDSESVAGEASRSLGVGEDVSEESISKVQKDVIELAEKVAEYREKGPVAFALLLEKSLVQMRSSLPSADTPVRKPRSLAAIEDEVVSSEEEALARRTDLMERLALAKASLASILPDIRSCKERLDKAITALKQTPTKNLPQYQASLNLPQHQASVKLAGHASEVSQL